MERPRSTSAPAERIPPTFHLPRWTRRSLIVNGIAGGLTWAASQAWPAAERSAVSHLALETGHEEGNVVVVLFLRGGVDGLNVVIPHAEDAYFRARPNLALGAPKGSVKDPKSRVLDLDGFFGLHPALAPLLPLYREGELGVLHAVGSNDESRSHFEAMTAMERGLAQNGAGPASGWLARHLMTKRRATESPLRAVAFSGGLPDSLRGSTDAVAMLSLTDYRITFPEAMADGDAWKRALSGLYGAQGDAVAVAGQETLDTLRTLEKMDAARYRPAHGAAYPDTPLGTGLKQAACLIKGRVGLEVVCLDQGGWDTHVAQGVSEGWQPNLMVNLAGSLAAFHKDLGPLNSRVTLLAMTEFGRRVRENTGLGTDHGRGSVAFLMGGGVNGGRVVARWPGLSEERLEPPGDLRVTTDYREVLAELLAARLANSRVTEVFPGFTPRPLGLFGPA